MHVGWPFVVSTTVFLCLFLSPTDYMNHWKYYTFLAALVHCVPECNIIGKHWLVNQESIGFYFHSQVSQIQQVFIMSLWRAIPYGDRKAWWSSVDRKIPNMVGAITNPCLTLHLRLNGSEISPSKMTLAVIPSSKTWIICRSFSGHLIFSRTLYSPLPLTVSNNFVRSINTMLNGLFAL